MPVLLGQAAVAGEHQGKTPLYLLCASSEGRALLMEHKDLWNLVTKEMLEKPDKDGAHAGRFIESSDNAVLKSWVRDLYSVSKKRKQGDPSSMFFNPPKPSGEGEAKRRGRVNLPANSAVNDTTRSRAGKK